MKRFLTLILLSLIVLLGIGGCDQNARQSHAKLPNVIVESFNPTLDIFAPMWQKEVARRFDNAVVILVHGGDFEGGRWVVGASLQPWQHIMTAQDLVRYVQAEYPDRTVVLTACNPGHLQLGVRGVYYAESSVWCVPDRAIELPDVPAPFKRATMLFGQREAAAKKLAPTFSNRWEENPDVVGNIFEFVKE